MKKEDKLLKRTAIYAVGNIGSKVLSALIVPLYTYFITTAEMGTYDLIVTSLSLACPAIVFAIYEGVYRWLLQDTNNAEELIKSGFHITIRNIVIAAVLFSIVSLFVKIPYFWLILLLCIAECIYQYVHMVVRGLQKTVRYAVGGLVYSIVMLTCNVLLVCVYKLGIQGLLISLIASNIGSSVYELLGRKEIISVIRSKRELSVEREMLRYSIVLVPNAVIWWLIFSSDKYLIAVFLGVAANGIYAISQKFPSLLSMCTTLFHTAWQDQAIEEYTSKERDAYYSKIFNMYYRLLLCAVLCLIPITKYYILWTMDEAYHEAYLYVSILYVGGVFQAFAAFYGTGYTSSKDSKGAMTTTIMGAIVNVIFNVALIRSIGIHAASISTFIAFFTVWIVRVFRTRKYFSISFDKMPFILLSAGCILYSFLVAYTDLAIDCVLFLICCLVALYVNREMFKQLLKRLQPL